MTLEEARAIRKAFKKLERAIEDSDDSTYRWQVLECALTMQRGLLRMMYGDDWVEQVNRLL